MIWVLLLVLWGYGAVVTTMNAVRIDEAEGIKAEFTVQETFTIGLIMYAIWPLPAYAMFNEDW